MYNVKYTYIEKKIYNLVHILIKNKKRWKKCIFSTLCRKKTVPSKMWEAKKCILSIML